MCSDELKSISLLPFAIKLEKCGTTSFANTFVPITSRNWILFRPPSFPTLITFKSSKPVPPPSFHLVTFIFSLRKERKDLSKSLVPVSSILGAPLLHKEVITSKKVMDDIKSLLIWWTMVLYLYLFIYFFNEWIDIIYKRTLICQVSHRWVVY